MYLPFSILILKLQGEGGVLHISAVVLVHSKQNIRQAEQLALLLDIFVYELCRQPYFMNKILPYTYYFLVLGSLSGKIFHFVQCK